MTKKCIVCNSEAVYKIKDTSDYYCADCAQENFADLNLLVKVEEEAQQLKRFLEKSKELLEEGKEDEEKEEEKEEKENQADENK